MLNYLKHLILIAVELWINMSVCVLYESQIVRLTPVVYLILQPFWIYDNLNMPMRFLAFITHVYMQKVLIHVKKQLSYGYFPAIAAILASILKNPMT